MIEKIKNRRRGPDTIIKAIKFFTILSWIVIIVTLVVWAIVKTKAGSGRLLTGTSTEVLKYIFYMLILQALLCGLGLAISATRMKRKSDKLNLSLLFFEIISIIGIIMYIIYI